MRGNGQANAFTIVGSPVNECVNDYPNSRTTLLVCFKSNLLLHSRCQVLFPAVDLTVT